jgi:branched-chain amino acid transport system permease protein
MSSKKIEIIKKILLLALLFSMPLIITNRYNQHIINMILIYIILGMSLNLVFGYTGLLSLGHAAFFGIGAYVSAILSVKLGFPFIICFIISGFAGAIAGLAIGFPTLRLAGPYFAMATIGLNKILEMVFLNWDSVTGGPAGIADIPHTNIFGLTFKYEFDYYYIIAFVLCALYWTYRNLVRSDFGKTVVALRDNALAAEAMGVNTSSLRISIFTLSTVFAALAGSLYAHTVRYVAPESFTVMESIAILILVVIGGPGFLVGPFYGAIILVLANEYLQYLENFNMLIYGVVIMALLVFLPSGIAGLLESVRYRYYQRKNITDYVREVGIEEMK